MRDPRARRAAAAAFTLVEMLVVIAIMVILLAVAVTVGRHVAEQAKEQNTRATLSLLVSALQEYQQARQRAGGDWPPAVGEITFAQITDQTPPPILPGVIPAQSIPGNHDGDDNQKTASSEVLYFYLSEEPRSRAVLAGLGEQAAVNQDGDSVVLQIAGATQTRTLIEVVDAWGKPLLYQTGAAGSFPTLTSAGPDEEFDSADDIISTEL